MKRKKALRLALEAIGYFEWTDLDYDHVMQVRNDLRERQHRLARKLFQGKSKGMSITNAVWDETGDHLKLSFQFSPRTATKEPRDSSGK